MKGFVAQLVLCSVLCLAVPVKSTGFRNWESAGCSLMTADPQQFTDTNRLMDCSSDSTGGTLTVIPSEVPVDSLTNPIETGIIGHLWLSGNQLKNIYASDVVGFTHLKQLHADNNGLVSIEEGAFSEMPDLEFLLIQNNALKGIPAGLRFLGNLRYADISNNLVRTLSPNDFAGLNRLRWLNLAGNRVKWVLCGTFNQLQESLNYLNMSGSLNKANCGIQVYPASNPMAGIDATIMCDCPNASPEGNGPLGFCEQSGGTCSLPPPLLSLRAQSVMVDQSWERICTGIEHWVGQGHHQHGSLLNYVDGPNNLVNDKEDESSSGGPSSAVLGLLVGLTVMAVMTLLAAVVLRHQRQKGMSTISEIASSYASSEAGKPSQGLPRVISHSGMSESNTVTSFAKSDQMNRPMSKFECNANALSPAHISTSSLGSHMVSATEQPSEIENQPSFKAHAAPSISTHIQETEIEISEN
eukprot:m.338975 g.338975  ORF g.338975 m.338975 type:complete len:469 (-) comp18616_c0_seq1:1497-2903(-)